MRTGQLLTYHLGYAMLLCATAAAACSAGTPSGTQNTRVTAPPSDLPATSTGMPLRGEQPAAPTTDAPAAVAPSAEPPPSTSLCNSPTARKVEVATTAALTAALADAHGMDAIVLAPGTYEGAFVAHAVGTPQAPIALCGSAQSILRGTSLTTGYTLYLQNAQYWQLVGFAVSGGAKGIMLDGAAYNLIKDVTVSGTGSEGIHLRRPSHDNVVDGCHVTATGSAGNPKFGEGIYIGSSMNNWCTLTAGEADRSDRNTVQYCTIAQTTSEAIDIKEGTSDGRILGNTLDGTNLDPANASSLVNVKGNGYLLQNNQAMRSPTDAFSIHVILPGWGACNQFVGNKAADALAGFGIHMAAGMPWPEVLVTDDNSFPKAAAGVSNVPLTAGAVPKQTCSVPSTSMSVSCGP